MQQTLIPTALPFLTLRRLSPQDAQFIFELVQRNKAHLTAHGDYLQQVAASIDDIASELSGVPERHWRFGVYLSGDLVGRVDLLGVEPPRYGLGYWLSSLQTGQGLMTEAVRAVLDFAANECGATDIFAGVTRGNERSAALLTRLDFRPTERFDTYIRYHLALG